MKLVKHIGLSVLFGLLSQVVMAQGEAASRSLPLAPKDPQPSLYSQFNSGVKSAETDKSVKVNSVIIPKSEVTEDIQKRLVKREAPKAVEIEENCSPIETMFDWVKDKYATILNVMPGQISNVMLYKFIEEWYGTRYRMGGTTKSGVDCSAFVQHLYQYVFQQPLLRTAGMQFESSTQIIKNMSDLREGDLVFFKINSSRITHVGVYLRNNFFVHSSSSKGVSIASLQSNYWQKYFVGGGRVENK
ncbi:MAG: C40 family peptidase [Chitinophagaceae bacterium]